MGAAFALMPLLTIMGSISQAGMMIWYAVIAIGFTILLGIGMLFGGHDHDGDAGHDGDSDGHDGVEHDSGVDNLSVFSVKTIFWFGAGLGAGGFFAAYAGLSLGWTLVIGCMVGLVIAGIGYSLMNYLYRRQYSDTIHVQDAIGKTAIVSTTIYPDGVGAVNVNLNGAQQSFSARTMGAVALKIGTEAKVKAVVGTGTLLVEAEAEQVA